MKNKYTIVGDVVRIYLNQGKIATVSLIDFDKVNSFPTTWTATIGKNDSYYVITEHNYVKHRMHRVIMDCPRELVVDHINHNTLDNTRENLRICTVAENNRNRNYIGYKSKLSPNVYKLGKDRYQVKIMHKGILYTVSPFSTMDEANRVANEERDRISKL